MKMPQITYESTVPVGVDAAVAKIDKILPYFEL